MQVVEPLLGTRAEIEVESDDRSLVDAVEAAVLSEVRRLESVLSVFDPDSALHSFRRSGHTTIGELQTVVDLALDWHRRTSGAFHPALQPLIDVWRQAETDQVVPSPAAVADVVSELRSPAMRHLDLNAVAKGWIAQHAIEVGLSSTALGIDDQISGVWLSLGGDLVHRGAGTVVVGIEDPHRPYDNVAPMVTIDIGNEALATSGSARRWWTIGGRRYSRVLDPRTGWPADHVASASVVATDAATADALATAALVLDPEETMDLVDAEEVDCLLVLADGSRVASSDRFRPG